MCDTGTLKTSHNPLELTAPTPDPSVHDLMLASIPKLRAFAISLCRNGDRADDLVQDALLRAWVNISLFAPGSNMYAWLCTILRNHFYTECQRGRRRFATLDTVADGKGVKPHQMVRAQYNDLCAALAKLSPKHRQALLMVAASGLSYDKVAKLWGCPTGTVKSRVNRARSELARMLSIGGLEVFEEDPLFSAVIESGDRVGGGVTNADITHSL
jgi:RNA polymerase sigma-70 factor, ECF subfamily